MDNHPTSPLRKVSLPTFASSVPVEVAALPASTRSSFTRVDNNTRPGTAAGDNSDMGNEAAADGSDGASAPQLAEELEQVVEAAAVVVPQVPQTLLQFLLVSGRRRSMAFDPETTVGRVKELVWNSWPCGKSRGFHQCHRPLQVLCLSPFHCTCTPAPIVLEGRFHFLSSLFLSHHLYGGNFAILNMGVSSFPPD
jgi:hypothetical protein